MQGLHRAVPSVRSRGAKVMVQQGGVPAIIRAAVGRLDDLTVLISSGALWRRCRYAGRNQFIRDGVVNAGRWPAGFRRQAVLHG